MAIYYINRALLNLKWYQIYVEGPYPYFKSFGNQVIMVYSSTFKNKIQCGLLALKTEKNRELTCVANLGCEAAIKRVKARGRAAAHAAAVSYQIIWHRLSTKTSMVEIEPIYQKRIDG